MLWIVYHKDEKYIRATDSLAKIRGGDGMKKYSDEKQVKEETGLTNNTSKNSTLIRGAGEMGGFRQVKVWGVAHAKLIAVVCILVAGTVGTIGCGNTKEQEPEAETEVAAPLINTYSDKIYVGIGQEVSVQDEIIRSVVSYGEEAEVSVNCDGASINDGDGSVQNGVPDIIITFEEAGEYDIAISAEAEQSTKKSVDVTVTGKLSSHVKGIRDWNVEAGAENIDFMSGIEWDEDYVKKVAVNMEKIDLSKAGDYKIVYIVTLVAEAEGQSIEKIEATVHVLSKTDVEKKAGQGETVVASGNKTVEPATAISQKPKADTAKKGSSSATKKEQSADTKQKPSTDTKEEQSTAAQKEPAQSSTDTPAKEEKPDQPAAHTHNWQKRTETINHPEESHIEYIEHPATGHTEVKTIPEKYHYEQHWVYQCNGCKVKYYTDAEIGAHMKEQMLAGNIACGGYSSFMEQEKVVDTPESTQEVWVEDKAAWTEKKKVVDKEACTETKTYYVCSCGARKE